MALQKYKEDIYGNSGASYWKITNIDINYLKKTSRIRLAGYVSKETRDELKQPIENKIFNWSNDDFPFDENILKEQDKTIRIVAYNKIKTDRFFSDAKNV